MQTSSPKNIALFIAFALTALVLIFLIFFRKYLQIKFYGLNQQYYC